MEFLMWSLMVDVCREMGVRTDVPFRELTEQERKIVFDGPAEKSISCIRRKIPIRRESWILPITMRFILWKTHYPRSKMKKG